MSVKRHRQQPDQTLTRQAAVVELELNLAQLRQTEKEHLAEAAEAKAAYKRTYYENSHEVYTGLTKQFNSLPVAAFGPDGELLPGAPGASEVHDFLDKASKFKGGVDTDYQQDKSFPHFGKSPQPGPTYFMSHVTCYVHMLTSKTLGDLKGPGRFDANHFYTREQAGVSKCSNDTVCTLFDLLHGGQPQFVPLIFRTGFDVNGLIEGAGATTAAAAAPAAAPGTAGLSDSPVQPDDAPDAAAAAGDDAPDAAAANDASDAAAHAPEF